jgi:hypothetical protein
MCDIDSKYNCPILELKLEEYSNRHREFSENAYIEAIRWQSSLDKLIDYDFSIYNIQQIKIEMDAQISIKSIIPTMKFE